VGRAAAWAQLHVSDLYISLHASVIGTEAVGMNVEGLFVTAGFSLTSGLVDIRFGPIIYICRRRRRKLTPIVSH